jgi:hypothetical protein
MMGRDAVRVSARGYRRNGGERTILAEEIILAETQKDGESARPHTFYIKKDKNDDSINMRIGPRSLSGFGGEYTLHVQLTENEVAKLFWECFPQIRGVISQLHGLEALAEARLKELTLDLDLDDPRLFATGSVPDVKAADNVINLNKDTK